MTFSTFASSLLKLEETASRLAMTEQLADLFKQLSVDEVQPACYLLLGSLVPQYQSLEFQMSVKMVVRAIARLEGATEGLFDDATDSDESILNISALYKKRGDIGLVAQEVAESAAQKSSTHLDLLTVFNKLNNIAIYSGQGSQEEKVASLSELLKELDPLSARYVSRIVVGKLRLGFSTMTMLDALSWAVVGDKSEAAQLELLYQKQADVGFLAKAYLQNMNLPAAKRLSTLEEHIKVTVGVPVVPALCQRLNSAEEIIDKMKTVIVEPKYDGLRIQIHVQHQKNDQQNVQAYTRNLENVTHMFPELQDIFSRMQASTCILDAEAIGYNKETGKLLAFQETITRRRKHNVGEKAKQIPIRFYIFDVLELDGTELLSLPLQERKIVLNKLFVDNEVFLHAPFEVTDSEEKTRSLHRQFLAEGLEGAVMKQVDSRYISGRKGWSWVKIKEAEGTTGKLNDTLDCVVMGYYAGRGKRNQFGIGALLAGVVDQENQQIVTIAKIGTGLSEEQLQLIKKMCDQHAVKTQPTSYVVDKNLFPDVWVSPAIVVEIAADELTHSPIHSAKLAMRFPRLLKVRDDKSWEQATTLKELEQIKIA